MKTRTKWTVEQEGLLRGKYPTATKAELRKLFPGKTDSAIWSKAKKMRIRKLDEKFCFTKEQLDEVRSDYSTTASATLAERFGCSAHTIYNAACRMGLKKDIDFVREMARKNFTEDHPARAYWIKKGAVAKNKGKKQIEYMSPEAIERTKASRFKKGNVPHNARAVGFERIDKDGYVMVKATGRRKMELKHRLVWEEHRGAIPDGHCIQFLDGNRQNCDIENLYIISRVDQMKHENSLHARYPEDIRRLVQLKGALKRQINKTQKNESD